MKLSIRYRDEIAAVSSYLLDELDSLVTRIRAGWGVQHDESGKHTVITGKSLTLTADPHDPDATGEIDVDGDITSGGDGRFDGDVIANTDADDVGDRQAALSNYVNAAVEGPALILGKDGSSHQWAITADNLGTSPTIRRLRFTPVGDNPALRRYIMQVTQGGAGSTDWYLTGHDGSMAFYVGAPNSVFGPGFRAAGGYFTAMDVVNGYVERGRTTALGEWTNVAFNAANFTASAGNWTVDAGDQITLRYTLIGKTMIVAFTIAGTDVSAAPTQLRIAIPGGLTAAQRMDATCTIVNAGAAAEQGQIFVAAAGTTINIERNGGAAFTTTAGDNTNVVGQIAFEVQ